MSLRMRRRTLFLVNLAAVVLASVGLGTILGLNLTLPASASEPVPRCQPVLAEGCHMLPSSVLRHTATHYGAFDATTSAYVDGLAAGTVSSDAPIPPGGKLWVRK